MADCETFHVVPVNDLREHVEDGAGCWCCPRIDERVGGTIIVHNSMDGREKYETGERRPH